MKKICCRIELQKWSTGHYNHYCNWALLHTRMCSIISLLLLFKQKIQKPGLFALVVVVVVIEVVLVALLLLCLQLFISSLSLSAKHHHAKYLHIVINDMLNIKITFSNVMNIILISLRSSVALQVRLDGDVGSEWAIKSLTMHFNALIVAIQLVMVVVVVQHDQQHRNRDDHDDAVVFIKI